MKFPERTPGFRRRLLTFQHKQLLLYLCASLISPYSLSLSLVLFILLCIIFGLSMCLCGPALSLISSLMLLFEGMSKSVPSTDNLLHFHEILIQSLFFSKKNPNQRLISIVFNVSRKCLIKLGIILTGDYTQRDRQRDREEHVTDAL